MNITFIYTDNCVGNRNKFNVGLASLSAYLKNEGYDVSLIHIINDITQEELLSKIKDHNPDVLAFSYMSLTFPDAQKFVRWTNHLPIKKIHGGMQPTMDPEGTIRVDGIDVICLGEGEKALAEFCNAVKNGTSYDHINNLWIKLPNGNIKKNPIGPLVENLDDLPFLDHGIFEYEKLDDARDLGRLVVQASRGCYYKCTYCGNNYIWKLYPNKKKFLRSHSVEYLINGIEKAIRKYPMTTNVRFVDDTLTYDLEWFRKFAKLYKDKINLPYSGNDRVENITEEISRLLKESGCFSIDIGIENGDYQYRRKNMKRFMKNEEIISGIQRLRKAGIYTRAFNIFGMVNETKEVTLETVKVNAKALPDYFIKAYFTPLMNTEAAKMVKELELEVKASATSFFEEPQVDIKTMKSSEVEFFYKYFSGLVYFYNYLYRIDNRLLILISDKLILSRFFPYALLNKIFIAEGDLVRIAKNIGLYGIIRMPYRILKKVFTPEKGIESTK